ncbi:N-acetyltransferase [Polaribacter reichenbachii]|uniref:Transcriptional regulator n=1 Tax=Polaribacter reichenbachii TaxID=996801 RepID=A0A1B8U4X4_9FLAO|nr:GNAT family N-acetyltransferase [Polaribacter reichenbachii]APZ47983.1 N-acetyltransferase [Polaribacter reichenbachii]AUC18617.1 N-acetyltransferase [Polaribacter reichenbachii]OBY66912.1 transcriptional regulator [Polaribacter reichenbachii]
MDKIVKATFKDAKLLSKLGIDSFLTAHGHSAPKKDIENYLANNLTENNFTSELKDIRNEFYLLYVDNKLAGYSKIVFNKTNINIPAHNVTNLSRLYLLKEYYGLGLGKILFDFNIQLCKENKQSGIWLAVWVENQNAIKFYHKTGLKKVGNFDFKISETHSNPNHIMYLEF